MTTPLKTSEKIAALDIGSNSFHLVVVEGGADGSIKVLEHAKRMVRLGEASLGEGTIPGEAFDRGIAAADELSKIARAHRPDHILAVATSAVREAANGKDFVNAVRRHSDLAIRVLDGIEEAGLIYQGARQSLALDGQSAALFDVGGGSTEAILGSQHEAILCSSLKIGVLRLREHWQRTDPPSASDTAFMSEWVRTVMRPTIQRFQATGFDVVALTSGTAVQLARLAGERLPSVAGVGRHRLTLPALRLWEHRLSNLTAAERVNVVGLDPARVDTIVPGAVIIRSILEMTGAQQALVSEAALREGVIADYLRHLPIEAAPLAAEHTARPDGAQLT